MRRSNEFSGYQSTKSASADRARRSMPLQLPSPSRAAGNKGEGLGVRATARFFSLVQQTALLVLLAVPCCAAQDTLELTGDIKIVHDPCIIRCGSRYYLFCTGDGIPIRVSSDLRRWEPAGKVFADLPAWAKQKIPRSRNPWAPAIAFWGGRYRLYYAVSTFGSNRSAIGLATNATLDPADPAYKWVDEGTVIESVPGKDDWNAIDPNVALAPDGVPWLAFGSFWSGLKLVRLNRETGKPSSTPPELISAAARPGANAIEAPCILFRKNRCYLFASYDFCCRGADSTYKIKVGRSNRIEGPYLDRNGKPMMQGGGTPVIAGSDRWRGPGHNSVLLDGNDVWLVYHAYDAQDRGAPTLRISKLRWTRDGWPYVAGTPSRAAGEAGASPVGAWEHSADSGPAVMIHLLPNGRINVPDGNAAWTLKGRDLELRWPDDGAPGGAWVDRCRISADGSAYRGRNQSGKTVAGVRISREQP
jgi:arabinan endo-1,5-alpha-L-arabinosidase